jgi:hypothetical protein
LAGIDGVAIFICRYRDSCGWVDVRDNGGCGLKGRLEGRGSVIDRDGTAIHIDDLAS